MAPSSEWGWEEAPSFEPELLEAPSLEPGSELLVLAPFGRAELVMLGLMVCLIASVVGCRLAGQEVHVKCWQSPSAAMGQCRDQCWGGV